MDIHIDLIMQRALRKMIKDLDRDICLGGKAVEADFEVLPDEDPERKQLPPGKQEDR